MQTMIIAHRGASEQAPENTMPAFDLAWRMGSEGIETDVQLTKDNVPILIHDERINRTTNGRGYVKDYTYHELIQLDSGQWFNPSFSGTKIITLEQFLNWIKDKPLYLNIELKNNKIDYKGLELAVLELIAHYKVANRTTLSTFNPNSVNRLHKLNPTIDSALLLSKRKSSNLVQHAKALGANALHIKYRMLTPEIVEACRRESMALRVYTVNSSKHMLRCFQLGCTAIFTDIPDKALHFRKLYEDHH
ncbi:glycerophosphodiester phosphodiesterase [Lentibacillus saliphilus]|uniref:glycerophosphodiester phosphodiesterase n=1 Tax=Lentibacillus saliphilus TaxID=2737028 RepID=UPI001C3063DD|nr:glycerophosphodiester phosphodiesterase [Lentibacillus saliphilus]